MTRPGKARGALTAVRQHPVLTSAIGVSLVAVSVFTGSTMASANSVIPSLAVSAAAASAAPAPHVLLYNDGSTAHGPKAQRVVKAAPHLDGCDHDYGNANQCVPWTIPAGSPAADCAWLKSNGFGPLQVVGANRQHLPETRLNGAAYVCA